MLDIKEIIIVEGNYDKSKLSSLVNATIVVTDGFMIFKDKNGELKLTCHSPNGPYQAAEKLTFFKVTETADAIEI